LVHGDAPLSPDFLGYRLDGAIDSGGSGLFTDGRGNRTLGRTLVLYWHSLICGRASAHAPLPRLIFLLPSTLAMSLAELYLDHNATTPLDPDVLDAMRPYFLTAGNAESRHSFGRKARLAWEYSKETVAQILKADPSEVIFTSGGTEANNLAVFGLAGAESAPGHIVATPIEHPAIAEPLARLEAASFTINRVPVDNQGVADVPQMTRLFCDDTRFATLMLANNETGAIQPVCDLTVAARERGILVHTDAVQAVGRIPVSFQDLEVATLAASAHKFHGPPGIGLLLVRRGVRLGSRLFGGGQQQGRRPGTVPVPLVVGLATALQKWQSQYQTRSEHWITLRDRLEKGLIHTLGAGRVIRNGPTANDQRLPQTLNIGFPGLDGEALLMQLDMAGIAASLGSACASGSTRPSPTLMAMHVPDNWLRSSVRFSFGATTSEAEIDEAIMRITQVVIRIDASKPSMT
jgi:cysteine desulfurase